MRAPCYRHIAELERELLAELVPQRDGWQLYDAGDEDERVALMPVKPAPDAECLQVKPARPVDSGKRMRLRRPVAGDRYEGSVVFIDGVHYPIGPDGEPDTRLGLRPNYYGDYFYADADAPKWNSAASAAFLRRRRAVTTPRRRRLVS